VLEVKITSFEKYFVNAEILLWRMHGNCSWYDMSARGARTSKLCQID
jgi:hypothetical protein